MKRFKVHYHGSMFWLIFWLIFFFPLAIALFFTALDFQTGQTTYRLRYDGSRFWMGFWLLVFFPIAFLLFFLNGFSVEKT